MSLKLIKLTKSGMVYLKDLEKNKYYTVPPKNIYIYPTKSMSKAYKYILNKKIKMNKDNKFYFKIKLEHKDAITPKRANEFDAGLDVFSIENFTLVPNEYKLFDLGFKAEFSPGYVCDVRSKSGLALKQGLSVLNQPGTIDCHYRGNYGVILMNNNIDKSVEIIKGQKIAQLVFLKCETNFDIEVVETLTETKRGKGGFGSSGLV